MAFKIEVKLNINMMIHDSEVITGHTCSRGNKNREMETTKNIDEITIK